MSSAVQPTSSAVALGSPSLQSYGHPTYETHTSACILAVYEKKSSLDIDVLAVKSTTIVLHATKTAVNDGLRAKNLIPSAKSLPLKPVNGLSKPTSGFLKAIKRTNGPIDGANEARNTRNMPMNGFYEATNRHWKA